jgi:hypothetical protein
MKNTFKQGDTLYSSGGYNQTNINFYKIKKLVGKTMVEIVKLEKFSTSIEGNKTELDFYPRVNYELPYTLRRKIKQGAKRPYVSIDNYTIATKLTEPFVTGTHPNFGH